MPDSQQARRWYTELELKPWCSDEELQEAYRELAKKYHPDRHGGSEKAGARFQGITSSFNELLEHRKKWGAAKKPADDPLSGGQRSGSAGSSGGGGGGGGTGSAGSSSFYTGKTAGTSYSEGFSPGDHGGHGSSWPRPITEHFNGANGHLKAMYANQDPNYVFTGRGFRAPKHGVRGDPFGALNRATPQHYSQTEGRVRTVLCGTFLVCAGLLAWTAGSSARMPWQQSTLNSRWDSQPMGHGRHNAVAKQLAGATPSPASSAASARASEEARRLKIEGDAARSRGDYTAANAAYSKAATLVT